jgi:hypothetical protein
MFVLRPIEGKKDITHLISLSLKQSSLRRRGKPRRRRRITATNYVAEVQLPKGSTPLTAQQLDDVLVVDLGKDEHFFAELLLLLLTGH